MVKKKCNNNSRIRYITDYTSYPATVNNDISYYPLGELAFKEMIKELKKAEKFIFFEYFIVAPGKMWNSILEILKELNLKEYDAWELLKATKGIKYSDHLRYEKA